MRINHWVKNVVIFFPVFFAGKTENLSLEVLLTLSMAFLAFSLTSSSVYVLNDIKDVKRDQLHPDKMNRPIASGAVTTKKAYFFLTFLLLLSASIMTFIPFKVVQFILAYFFLNILYTFYTKKISLLDVSSISLGFVLRLYVGGEAANVLVSHWIVITVFLLMFSIALAKRKNDLILIEKGTEKDILSSSGYTVSFLNIAMVFCFSITVMTYILYTVSEEVMDRVQSEYIFITAFPVMIGILRYLQLAIVENKTGSPVDLIFKDKVLIASVLSWILIFYYLLYA